MWSNFDYVEVAYDYSLHYSVFKNPPKFMIQSLNKAQIIKFFKINILLFHSRNKLAYYYDLKGVKWLSLEEFLAIAEPSTSYIS